MVERDFSAFEFKVIQTDSVDDETFQQVKDVFAGNYREANQTYLEKNIGKLRFLAVAHDRNGRMAGFALGEARVIDLPRLPKANVNLAGLCCVSPDFRRHGLFGRLEGLALGAYKLPPAERYLSCGRCAHPASFRNFFRNPDAVPHLGKVPSEWQQDVGQAVVEAYGSPGFDPLTFRVHGSGVPIGWPAIEIEATAEEWEIFKPVDRNKGDSLLGIAWHPGPPAGWSA